VTIRLPQIPKTLEEFVAPETTALILWDIQKGLAGRAYNVDQVAEATGRLLRAADEAGVLVVWSRHVLPRLELIPAPFLRFLMAKQKVERVEDLKPTMQENMEETEFLPGFAPADHHIVIEKSAPSFFFNTPLDLRLKTCGITTLVVTGVATDIGIEFTVRHGQVLGYFSVVAEDATGSYTPEAQDRSIAFLRTQVPVVSAEEICAIWRGQ
jgi:nicotinamidase-related amidase